MKFEQYVSKIHKIASKKGFVTEEDIMGVIEKYDIPILLIQDLITEIQCSGIIIKEFRISESDKIKYNIKERISAYIVERYKLMNTDADELKQIFIKDYKNAKCQSSYIPVTVLGVIDRADINGQCDILQLSHFFIDFYNLRKLHGLIAEQPKSIFFNSELDIKQVKKLILFNPLGRSILIKYMWYDDEKDDVIVNPALWKSLTAPDLALIRDISKEHLNKYYIRITNNLNND